MTINANFVKLDQIAPRNLIRVLLEQSESGLHCLLRHMSLVMRKPTFWFPTWSDTNQTVQPQKMARGLKFQIYKSRGIVLSK